MHVDSDINMEAFWKEVPFRSPLLGRFYTNRVIKLACAVAIARRELTRICLADTLPSHVQYAPLNRSLCTPLACRR